MTYKSHFQIILSVSLFLLISIVDAKQFNGPDWSVDVQKAIHKFGENTAKKNQMTLIDSGNGFVLEAKKCHWDIHLMANRKWTVEQARPFVVEISQQFINLIYSHPKFLESVHLGHKLLPKLPFKGFGIFSIGIKLAFWDENVDRPLPPYLAQIRVVDGNILYFYADPKDQSLQLPPITETMEEAFEKAGRSLMLPACPSLSHHRSK